MPNSMPVFPAYDRKKRTMPNWKLQGTLVVPADAPAARTTGETVPDEGAFNPAVHTVDEVKAYIEANPDEAEDVFSAEVDGKDRSTLTAWITDFVIARDGGSDDDGG